jgi:peptidoglycan hydrolase-like protein with peptidoglycan-binding domain
MKKIVFIIIAVTVAICQFGYAEKDERSTQNTTMSEESGTAPLFGTRVAGNAPSSALTIGNFITTPPPMTHQERQDKLNTLSFSTLKVFQKAKRLKADGVFGPVSAWALFGRDIQRALKNVGYYDGEINGKFGPEIETAVKKFQKAHGLTIDGKVGIKTWSELKTYSDYSAKEKRQ